MENVRFKCKKIFNGNILKYQTDIIFEKDKWYFGYYNEKSGAYYIRANTSTEDFNTIDKYPLYSCDKSIFKKHFYSVEELREMEINEIIDD
tara:strand:- start:129012 stop:129284 length:273 start_codon:yes stop_codon:yes gene_type:complete